MGFSAVAAPAVAEGAAKGGEAAAGSGAAKGAEAALPGAAKGGEAAAGAAGAADVLGPAVAGTGAPLDLLAGGLAADTAIPAGLGAIEPATGALASGLATEPGLASAATGAFAPGLDTSLGGLVTGDVGLPTGASPTAFSGSALDNVAMGGTPSDLGAAGGASPLDTAAYPAGPVGAPGAAPTATGLPAELPGAAATGDPLGGGASGGGGIFDSLGIKNPLSAGIGAAGLGYSMLQGQKPAKFSPEMQAQAAALDANGQKMMSYLSSGTLPAGLQASLDSAKAAAKAKVVSSYASRGMSTNPTQNSALAAELAQVDTQSTIAIAQMGQQLMQAGLSEAGLSSQLYQFLSGVDQTQTANMGKAIANFAGAVSGSPTINIGGK